VRKHYSRHAHSKFNVVILLSFARCGPSAFAPSTPITFPDITHTHNHVVIIDATLPTNKHLMCLKHYCRHARAKFNVVMLLSIARCGPSACAPSTPMLLPDITHTHNHVVIIDATLPTHKQILCMLKHYCRHAPSKFNAVMLLSFARCGPNSFAPSSPILLSGTHDIARNTESLVLFG